MALGIQTTKQAPKQLKSRTMKVPTLTVLVAAALKLIQAPADAYTLTSLNRLLARRRYTNKPSNRPCGGRQLVPRQVKATLEPEDIDVNPSRRGWHRRVLKVFRKSKDKKELRMKGVQQIEDKRLSDTDAFILKAFDQQVPSMLFPKGSVQETGRTLDWPLPDGKSPLEEAVLEEAVLHFASGNGKAEVDGKAEVNSEGLEDSPGGEEGGSWIARVTRSWVGSILYNMLDTWSKGSHVNLSVKCDPRGGVGGLLLPGHFQCDASLDFDRIVFPRIRMSGGRLEAKRLALNLWSFTPDRIPIGGKKRYPNQFDFFAHNVTFTEEDLSDSLCIRNGLARLFKQRILKKRGIETRAVRISSISILPTGKISCKGEYAPLFGPPVSFEVRTRIGFASRGHILTFPGLELSLAPDLGIFVPIKLFGMTLDETFRWMTVDVGHNAQLLSVNIDGKQAQMRVSARTTITPEHTINRELENYIQSKDAYAAHVSVDVGRWVTRIGNFSA